MFEKQYELRYFEMNQYGEASPLTILTLLEEAAADHCLSIEYGLYDLMKQDIGWVLLGGYMQMERYPSYKEKVTIRTWMSRYATIRGIRENIIFDEQGNIIDKAKGLWLFFDIKRRRPVKIFEDIKKKWSYFPEESLKNDIRKKIEPIHSAKYSNKFRVHQFDIDSNKHVNNLRYLQWLIESIPHEIVDNYFLHTIDGRFTAEAYYGHTINSLTEYDNYDNAFIHTIKDLNNERVCVTAKSKWKKRL